MVTRPNLEIPPYISVHEKSVWIIEESLRSTTPTKESYEMLARFQQRQLQEKEQKLLQLYDQQQQRAHQVAQRGSAGSSGSNGSSNGSSINPGGKVRQMFEDRRQGNFKGIDKSYPLDPLNGRMKKNPAAASKPGVPRRANVGVKRATSKPDVNSNVGPANRTVAPQPQQRADSYSRESYASSRVLYKETNGQRENISRESHASSRGEYAESVGSTSLKQLNGHARNGQTYEINIDEVIDNEAMERNRMLAKFHSVDIDKRRRFSTDIDAERFPEEMLNDVENRGPEKPADAPAAVSRKSSLAEAKAKPANVRKSNATTKKPPANPMGARRSTVMKTTKSASLKVRKLPLNKKTLDERKKSSSSLKSDQVKEKSKRQCTVEKSKEQGSTQDFKEQKSRGKENFPEKLSLKSTPLVCEVIRSHNRIEQTSETDAIGIVKTIVTKMENIVTEVKMKNSESIEQQSAESSHQSQFSSSSVSTRKKRPSLFSSDLYQAAKTTEEVKLSADKSEETLLKNIENEDQGDGLVCQKEAASPPLRGNRESSVEHPTERQEITIADQTIKVEKEEEKQDSSLDASKKLTADCASRVRRASFELKRMMFEQIQGREKISRRDSVESALRLFDSIEADTTDYSEPVSTASLERLAKERKKSRAEESTRKLISSEISHESETRKFEAEGTPPASSVKNLSKDGDRKLSDGQPSGLKGFERSTSAWSIRTAKDNESHHLKTPVKVKPLVVSGKRVQSRRKIKKSASKKLLEARDSIELARVSVKQKIPGCRRRINFSSKTSPPTREPNAGATRSKSAPAAVKNKSNETVPNSVVSENKNDEAALNSTSAKKITEESVSNSGTKTAKIIETASTSVATKMKSDETASSQVMTKNKNDEAASVKSQSFQSSSRVSRLKTIFTTKQTCKTEKFSSSTTRSSNTDLASKKVDSSIKAAESIVRKNVSPYPSSKSPDRSEKSRSTTKAPATKLANRAAGSNGDLAAASENGFSTAARKSSVSAVDSPDLDSKNKTLDEKPGIPVTPAPRAASSLSSSQSGATKSQGSTSGRAHLKAKSNAAGPTPAHRSGPAAKNESDSSLITCKICNRRFTSERIILHEQICAKTSQKKRKQFDTVTHRVRGTELENFVQKPVNKKQSKASVSQKSRDEPQPSKSNWRRKHEDFINAIRSAKQMQTHLASGGKLSDLPPPPPSDTSDYIQCPHCSRRFNKAAAERHIPKCGSMQHNKPRAPPRSKR